MQMYPVQNVSRHPAIEERQSSDEVVCINLHKSTKICMHLQHLHKSLQVVSMEDNMGSTSLHQELNPLGIRGESLHRLDTLGSGQFGTVYK